MWTSTPLGGAARTAVTGLSLSLPLVELVNDVEDERRRGPRLRRAGVRPLEGSAREALEPGLVLRVRGCRLELEMEVRPGRVAGLADQTHRVAGLELGPLGHGRVEIREVAVRPRLAVGGLDREAGATALVPAPGVLDGAVRKGEEGRALRRDDVGGRVVVVPVRYRDDGGAAAD